MNKREIKMDIEIQSNTSSKNIKVNHLKRFIGVIVAPIKTMEDIAKTPSILIPGMIVALGFFILGIGRFTLYRDVFLSDITSKLPVEQRNTAAIIELIKSPLEDVIGWIVYSIIYFIPIKLLKGGSTYKHILSINGYVYMYKIIYYLACLFASFYTGQMFFQDSLVTIFPFLESVKEFNSYIYGYLNATSICAMFQFIVVAIGLKKVTNLKPKIVYCIVFIPYIISLSIEAFYAANI